MTTFLLRLVLVGIGAVLVGSCSPLDSAAIRHNDGIPVYSPPGGFGGGHRNFSAAPGAPC